jgi:type I restriction enzyme S subunit
VAHSDAGWSPKTQDHPRSGDEWGVLKVSAVSWDKFRAWENKQVLPGTEPRLQAEVKQGDFLISRANTAELIARAVLVAEPPFKLMMSDKIVRLRLSADINHRFVWIVNNYADFAREHYIQHASGVSPSMKNVSRDVILSLPLPLPPLAEQHRIVAKVDELMALCDRLEASLTATASTRRRLLDALLAEALAPAKDRELEAAE